MGWFSKLRRQGRTEKLREGQFIRATRFPLRVPLRYRCQGEREWHAGASENISCTGVLFRADRLLETTTPVELSFSLPTQITGDAEVRVFCAGYIVRSVRPELAMQAPALAAAAIVDYRLMYGQQRKEAALSEKAREYSAWGFASGTAREINDQLAIIVGKTEMVLSQAEVPDRLHRNLEEAKNAALRAASLIQRLATQIQDGTT